MIPTGQIWRAIPEGFFFSTRPARDGWPLRHFTWPAAYPRGSILFQAGRGDFVEKYLEVLGHWRDRGWNVTGFDWRGQGGSGRVLDDPMTGHATSFDPLVEDLAEAVAAWITDSPPPHILIGHSMGGHLILRLLAEHAPPVTSAVLVAPMLGFASAPVPAWLAGLMARSAVALGRGERPAWRDGVRPEFYERQRLTNLTHCPARYADEQYWKQEHPEIALGAPSWGWLVAALRSSARLRASGVLEAIDVPILLLGATHDRLVSAAAIRRAAARLPHARLRMFDDGAHELLREADAVRLPVLAEIDAFLDARISPS